MTPFYLSLRNTRPISADVAAMLVAAAANASPAQMRLLQPLIDKANEVHNSLCNLIATVQFVVNGGQPCSLSDMLNANADDAEVCEWAKTARPGDTFPALVDCRCIASIEAAQC